MTGARKRDVSRRTARGESRSFTAAVPAELWRDMFARISSTGISVALTDVGHDRPSHLAPESRLGIPESPWTEGH